MTLTNASADVLRRDSAVIAPALQRETDLVIERAQGSHLWTTDGRSYLDFACGIAVTNVGHNHPKVVAAAKAQIDRAIHLADVVHYPSMVEAGEALARISPGALGVSFFGNSGAEAVEGSIKLARYVTRRPGIIAFQGAFHGRTYGALSLTTSKARYREHYEPFLPSVYHSPYPNPHRCPLGASPENCADACFTYLRDRVLAHQIAPSQVAAVIIEPMLGEGGYVPAPAEFLRNLRALCDEHGILLICDEIQSGVGRTGKWFACEHAGVVPDVMAVAKALASGFPLGAVHTTTELAQKWPAAAHGTTFGGNPVSCAAAVATIQVMEEEGLVERAARLGAHSQGRLRSLQERTARVGDVRGLGMMIGVEVVDERGLPDAAAVKRVRAECLDQGVVVLSCGSNSNVLRILPALTISENDLDEGLSALEAALLEL